MSDYRRIIVPYDYSEHAKAALSVAVDLARRLNSDIYPIYVVHRPDYPFAFGAVGQTSAPPIIDMHELCTQAMDSLSKDITDIDIQGKVEPRVVEGNDTAAILAQQADELNADLIVMGTHGHTGISHLLLGSVAERTLRLAPCPVMTTKAKGG